MGLFGRQPRAVRAGTAEHATAALKALLEAVRDHAPETNNEQRKKYRDALTKLQRSIRPDMTVDSWQRLRKDLTAEVSAYAQVVDLHRRRHDKVMKESMAALAVMAETLAPGEQWHPARFHGLGRKLKRLASSRGFQSLSVKLEHEIRNLERYGEDQAALDPQAVGRLAAASPKNTAWMETLDPLTGLPDALEATAGYQRRGESGRSFCVIHLRIERFGSFSERHGMEAVSGIVRQFARRLRYQMDESCPAYRWHGPEFVAYQEGDAMALAERWSRIQTEMSGIYRIRAGASHVQYALHCVADVMEFVKGESLEEAIARGARSQLKHVHHAATEEPQPVEESCSGH